jgi:uncharacterized protein (TIGR03435 family)
MIPGSITAVGQSMTSLSSSLSRFVARPVADHTGLTGLFDFELTWTPDLPSDVSPVAPAPTIDPNGPSLFTALDEQLGLKLESSKGPVDVLVIDRVERPTPD